MQTPEGCIPLVGEGDPGDTCGIPTCITAHHGIAVWVPHRCTRSQCPVCADDGYVSDEAARILTHIQRRILGRCEVDHGLHKGRTVKVYTFIYSPREGYSIDSEEAHAKERRRMYNRLRDHGLAYGWAVYHPYRGDHGPNDSGPTIRGAMDRTEQSGHWHGIALSHWSSPAAVDQGYYLGVDCIGQLIDGLYNKEGDWVPLNLPLLWGHINKKIRYMLNHAAVLPGQQVVCRWGRWPYEGEERPKAIPQWRHPDTGQIYVLSRPLFVTRLLRDESMDINDPRYVWDDNPGIMETIKEEFARRALWHSPIGDPVDILGGDTYRPMAYSAVRCEPDDRRGAEWDAHLMSLLPCSRRRALHKNDEAPQGTAPAGPRVGQS